MTALIYAVSELLVWLLTFAIPSLVILLVFVVVLTLQHGLMSRIPSFKTRYRIETGHVWIGPVKRSTLDAIVNSLRELANRNMHVSSVIEI